MTTQTKENVVSMSKELRPVKIKTEAQFKQSLTKARENQQAAWQAIQDCVEFGIVKYLTASGDTSYLTRSIQLAYAMEATDPAVLKGYICSLCNVVLVKDNLGQVMFKKAMKGRPWGDLPEEGMNWWDFKDEGVRQGVIRPDMIDIVAEIKKLQERVAKKLKDHKVPGQQAELAAKFIAGEMSLEEIKGMEVLKREQLFSGGEGQGEAAQPEPIARDKAEQAQKPRQRKQANG